MDHRADAAHALDVSGTLHLTQGVADNGPADAQLGGQVYLSGQTVGLGVTARPQLLQERGDDTVADDGAAEAAGRRKAGISHGLFPPVHIRGLRPAQTSGAGCGPVPQIKYNIN